MPPKKKEAVAKAPVKRVRKAQVKKTDVAAAAKKRIRTPRKKKETAINLPVAQVADDKNFQSVKYSTGPVLQKFEEERQFEFPVGYGDNRVVLMIRDPHWLFAYWEVSDWRKNEIIKEIGGEVFSVSKTILRVYDVGGWNYFDIDLSFGARNWYIHVPVPNRTYCVDFGYLTPDGKFIAAARSNWVTAPLDSMSDVIDEEWMIPDWNAMYALSGGFGVGRSSEEIREMMKNRLKQEISSGWVTSLSSPVGGMVERPFWLVANCELIVYGATEPTATLTVQGRKIDLKEDGSFSLRFSLPDGQQVIPIEATRDDGKERRSITPSIERKTE